MTIGPATGMVGDGRTSLRAGRRVVLRRYPPADGQVAPTTDLFCGAGGSSWGLLRAGLRLAANHSPRCIFTAPVKERSGCPAEARCAARALPRRRSLGRVLGLGHPGGEHRHAVPGTICRPTLGPCLLVSDRDQVIRTYHQRDHPSRDHTGRTVSVRPICSRWTAPITHSASKPRLWPGDRARVSGDS